jgi:hypothetical protein
LVRTSFMLFLACSSWYLVRTHLRLLHATVEAGRAAKRRSTR